MLWRSVSKWFLFVTGWVVDQLLTVTRMPLDHCSVPGDDVESVSLTAFCWLCSVQQLVIWLGQRCCQAMSLEISGLSFSTMWLHFVMGKPWPRESSSRMSLTHCIPFPITRHRLIMIQSQRCRMFKRHCDYYKAKCVMYMEYMWITTQGAVQRARAS